MISATGRETHKQFSISSLFEDNEIPFENDWIDVGKKMYRLKRKKIESKMTVNDLVFVTVSMLIFVVDSSRFCSAYLQQFDEDIYCVLNWLGSSEKKNELKTEMAENLIDILNDNTNEWSTTTKQLIRVNNKRKSIEFYHLDVRIEEAKKRNVEVILVISEKFFYIRKKLAFREIDINFNKFFFPGKIKISKE